jgi:hypothetical protein
MSNDNSDSPLEWSNEKRAELEASLPNGQGWYSCNCKGTKGFCKHYLGMCMPYALCEEHSKVDGYRKVRSGFGKAKESKCELCVSRSGLYH